MAGKRRIKAPGDRSQIYYYNRGTAAQLPPNFTEEVSHMTRVQRAKVLIGICLGINALLKGRSNGTLGMQASQAPEAQEG